MHDSTLDRIDGVNLLKRNEQHERGTVVIRGGSPGIALLAVARRASGLACSGCDSVVHVRLRRQYEVASLTRRSSRFHSPVKCCGNPAAASIER